MRKMIGALAVAAFLSSAATLLAADYKDCWAHAEDLAGVNYTAVWTSSAAHDDHELDEWLGYVATRAECDALFATWSI